MRRLWTTAWIVGTAMAWSSLAGAVESTQEILQRSLRAVREASFTANVIIKVPQGEQPRDVVELVLYRRPPNEVRLEPVVDSAKGVEEWYMLEKGGWTFRLLPQRKEAFVVGKPRVSPVFAMIEGFLERGLTDADTRVAEVPGMGQAMQSVRIYSPNAESPFEIVVDRSDYLPRVIVIRSPKGDAWMMLVLSAVEVVPPDSFAAGFFDVPERWKVIGMPAPLHAGERERLQQFHMRMRMMHRQKSVMDAKTSGTPGEPLAEEKASSEEPSDFLPLLPARLPDGFELAEVLPLFFRGRLVFHIQLINPKEHQLISIFQARGLESFGETGRLGLPGRNSVERRIGDEEGILVLLLSSAVGKEQLQELADSLQEDPERAEKLLSEGIDQILQESQPMGE